MTKGFRMAGKRRSLSDWLGRILCRIGLHDYELIEKVGGFGEAGSVEKFGCKRCGHLLTKAG